MLGHVGYLVTPCSSLTSSIAGTELGFSHSKLWLRSRLRHGQRPVQQARRRLQGQQRRAARQERRTGRPLVDPRPEGLLRRIRRFRLPAPAPRRPGHARLPRPQAVPERGARARGGPQRLRRLPHRHHPARGHPPGHRPRGTPQPGRGRGHPARTAEPHRRPQSGPPPTAADEPGTPSAPAPSPATSTAPPRTPRRPRASRPSHRSKPSPAPKRTATTSPPAAGSTSATSQPFRLYPGNQTQEG
ncbi:hypothetical protein SMICM17S_05714 [Streptomyces microflavus]